MTQFLSFPGTNYTNIVIFKNGFSTLGAISFYKHFNKIFPENISTWHVVKKYKILFNNYNKEDKLFVVWRDPLERMISMYKDLNNHANLKNAFGKNFKEFLKNYIIKSRQKNTDAHIKRQHLFLTDFNKENILIVKIKDLPVFAKYELKYDLDFKIRNKTDHISLENEIIQMNNFTRAFKEEFKKDYDILNEYNVYSPSY